MHTDPPSPSTLTTAFAEGAAPPRLALRSLIRPSSIRVRPERDVLRAAGDLASAAVACSPVVDDGERVVGVLSLSDCLRVILRDIYGGGDPTSTAVEQIMVTRPTGIQVDTSVCEVARQFADQPSICIPVLDGDHLLGLVFIHDVVEALAHVGDRCRYESTHHPSTRSLIPAPREPVLGPARLAAWIHRFGGT